MPDNWSYVFAAYGVAALALRGYWRHLSRRLRLLTGVKRRGGRRAA